MSPDWPELINALASAQRSLASEITCVLTYTFSEFFCRLLHDVQHPNDTRNTDTSDGGRVPLLQCMPLSCLLPRSTLTIIHVLHRLGNEPSRAEFEVSSVRVEPS